MLSLDAQEADIKKILEEIFKETVVGIEIGPKIEGSISSTFHGDPLEEALKKMTSNWEMVFPDEKGKNDLKSIES